MVYGKLSSSKEIPVNASLNFRLVRKLKQGIFKCKVLKVKNKKQYLNVQTIFSKHADLVLQN